MRLKSTIPTEVVVDIGEEDNNKTLVSAAFSGNKAVVRHGNTLYMININELNMDETEAKECDSKNHSKD